MLKLTPEQIYDCDLGVYCEFVGESIEENIKRKEKKLELITLNIERVRDFIEKYHLDHIYRDGITAQDFYILLEKEAEKLKDGIDKHKEWMNSSYPF